MSIPRSGPWLLPRTTWPTRIVDGYRRMQPASDSDVFDRAIASFAVAYADQNESDHAALDRAVRAGKVPAVFEAEK